MPSTIETKYLLKAGSVHKMISWLSCRLQGEKEYPAGIVSSIYYDTIRWDFLNEKINSDYLKSKVRLRWYQDLKTGTALGNSYLEIKRKIGVRRKKVRLLTSLSGQSLEDIELSHSSLSHLPSLLAVREGLTFRDPLFPVFLIRYKRLRFLEPLTGTRVCVDYDIHVPRVNRTFSLLRNQAKLECAVVELKGGVRHLPEWMTFLTLIGCRKETFSKYQACYQKLMNTTS